MKNKLVIVLTSIGGVLFVPVIVAYLSSLYWKWQTFLLNGIFNTSTWRGEDIFMATILLCLLGMGIGSAIIGYGLEGKSEDSSENPNHPQNG